MPEIMPNTLCIGSVHKINFGSEKIMANDVLSEMKYIPNTGDSQFNAFATVQPFDGPDNFTITSMHFCMNSQDNGASIWFLGRPLPTGGTPHIHVSYISDNGDFLWTDIQPMQVLSVLYNFNYLIRVLGEMDKGRLLGLPPQSEQSITQ